MNALDAAERLPERQRLLEDVGDGEGEEEERHGLHRGCGREEGVWRATGVVFDTGAHGEGSQRSLFDSLNRHRTPPASYVIDALHSQ
jgi:hypothetical protein